MVLRKFISMRIIIIINIVVDLLALINIYFFTRVHPTYIISYLHC